MKKTKAKYIGPDDVEFRTGNIYSIYKVEEIPDGSLIAAENKYGEGYLMPSKYFEKIED